MPVKPRHLEILTRLLLAFELKTSSFLEDFVKMNEIDKKQVTEVGKKWEWCPDPLERLQQTDLWLNVMKRGA